MKAVRTRRSKKSSKSGEVHIQSWTLSHPGGGNPSHSTIEDVPTLDLMDGTSLSKKTSASSPNLLNGDHASPAPLLDASARINTPVRASKRQNSITRRAISANHELITPTSPTMTTTTGTHAGTPRTTEIPADATSSPSAETSPWSGAVGKASLGKSGRVIERLMADADKLKRELNAEIFHRQEIEKRELLSKSTIDALRGENSNLQQAQEVDAGVLKRRNRKIEDLKADLDMERGKRAYAEAMARQASASRDEVVASSRLEISEAREIAKHATSHADVLEQSHKQLGTEYRQRAETFSNDLQRLLDDREDERRRVKKLDGLVEQLKQEVDRTNKINSQLNQLFAAYKEGAEREIGQLTEKARRNEAADTALRTEAERVVGEARWLLNMTKNAKEHEERK